MRAKKSLGVRIFIRICVVFMVISLIWVYVVYMFTPEQPVENTEWTETNVEENSEETVTEILPEINPENPENTAAPILVTEGGEVDEMDQTVEVTLENGETELVRLGDLTDAVQID